MAARFERLRPDYFLTLSLPRSAWPTRENMRELQDGCRSFLRYLQRGNLVEAYGWVREVGAPRSECVCDPSLQGCICGANGRQLHRHFGLRLASGGRNRYGRPWLPYEALQRAAKRCGLGTLDLRQVFSAKGAAKYVAKYLSKDLGAADVPVVSAAARLCSPCGGRGVFGGTYAGKRRCPGCGGRGVVVSTSSRSPRRYALSVPDDTPRAEGWSYTWRSPALIALETTGEVIPAGAVFWSLDTS